MQWYLNRCSQCPPDETSLNWEIMVQQQPVKRQAGGLGFFVEMRNVLGRKSTKQDLN